jgi:hypothetical protein
MIDEEAIKIKEAILTFMNGASNFFATITGEYLDNIFKYQRGVVESYELLKKYPGWSPNFVQWFSHDVLSCASCSFVCQAKRKDQEVVKGMDQTVIMQLKTDFHLHQHYV